MFGTHVIFMCSARLVNSTNSHLISFGYSGLLFPHLPLVLPSGLFLLGLNNYSHAVSMHCTVCSTRLAHLVLLYFMNQILFDQQHISWSYPFCNLVSNFTQNATQQEHIGAATQFKTLSAGPNAACRCHNVVCTVWSIT